VTALLFEAARARRELEASLSRRLAERGYDEALLPILDYFDPYGPMLSSAAREQLYRFVDRDGQLLALRADFTPMLARLLAPRLEALELPLRIFYRGDVVRYLEGKPGQLREYSQLGAELLTPLDGGDDARNRSDAEVVELLLELLSDSLRGAGDRAAAPAPAIRLVLGLAGALDPLLAAAARRKDDDPRSLAVAVARRDRIRARAASAELLAVVERGFPDDPRSLGGAAAELERVLRLRERLETRFASGPAGARIHVAVDLAEFAAEGIETASVEAAAAPTAGVRPTPRDPGLARSSYYDGVVFRAYLDGLGQPLASGGRYDGLFRRLGAPVRAAGFQVALDPLLEAAGGGRSTAGRSRSLAEAAR
jgi:ATP phosphoribosyltransferase regulatory subunit